MWIIGGGVLLAAVLFTVFSLNCAWWRRRVPANIPTFLMLHSISDAVVDATCANNSVRPSELDALIVRLKKRGYMFQTVSAAIESPADRSIVLTFDDGYVDNYTELFPILKRRNVPATCFVTDQGQNDAAFLSDAQKREMDASGLVEFGGHTSSHTILTEISPSACLPAVTENKRCLEAVLGHPVAAFAYPCGGTSDAIVEIVKKAGYRYALTMEKGMRPPQTDLFRIHRQIIPRGLKPWQAYLVATRGRYRA